MDPGRLSSCLSRPMQDAGSHGANKSEAVRVTQAEKFTALRFSEPQLGFTSAGSGRVLRLRACRVQDSSASFSLIHILKFALTSLLQHFSFPMMLPYRASDPTLPAVTFKPINKTHPCRCRFIFFPKSLCRNCGAGSL